MHKILIAPTAFKGTLSPVAIANALARGIAANKASKDTVQTTLLPLADGGDGTVEAVHVGAGGRMRVLPVTANGYDNKAQWLDMGDEALVELSSACGLSQIRGELQPLSTNTSALGEVIARVLQLGFRHVNVAVGGSASTDGGAGLLYALGARFFDASGAAITTINGKTVGDITRCDLSGLAATTANVRFQVLTDVENPLCGPNGAAYIFGPQKGARPDQIEALESNLSSFAAALEKATGRHVRDAAGAGAAGGTAFGLASALGANITSGFHWVSSICGLSERVADCQLVITGEGRFDSQSIQGKVIGEMIKVCQAAAKPLWVVTGSAEFGSGRLPGVDQIIIPEHSGTHCTEADISRAVEDSSALHDFFTSAT